MKELNYLDKKNVTTVAVFFTVFSSIFRNTKVNFFNVIFLCPSNKILKMLQRFFTDDIFNIRFLKGEEKQKMSNNRKYEGKPLQK